MNNMTLFSNQTGKLLLVIIISLFSCIMSYYVGKSKSTTCDIDPKFISYHVKESVYENRIKYIVMKVDSKCGYTSIHHEHSFLKLESALAFSSKLNILNNQ